MEDYRKNWEGCLRMLRERAGNERVYEVWFSGIEMESYDADRNAIVLRVPSNYVYEYLEMHCVRLLSQVLDANFKPGVRLAYRVQKEPSFSQAVDYLKQQGFDAGTVRPPQFSIPNARARLEAGLRHFLGEAAQWVPGYDDLADWLGDNKGKGLLLVGTPGLGKTLICRSILPVLFGRNIVSCTALEMNSRIDDLLKEKCIIVDDLGKEPVETRTYGNRRTPFFELCNAAEQQGKLLVINTNLSTTPTRDTRYPTSIKERYGEAVLSRLRATVHVVIFEGKDMRK